MDDLPEPLLLHIFYRLPQREAHICMSVCKYWHSLLSHPSFVESYTLLENTRRHGLSSRQRMPATLYFLRLDEHNKRWPLTHITPRDRFWRINTKNSRGHKKRWYRNSMRVSFNFLPAVSSAIVNQRVYCAGSSKGLVLCYELQVNRTRGRRDLLSGYYVCNPLTRKWVAVPPGPIETAEQADAIRLMGFACDPRQDADCVTRFKVVNVVDSAVTGGSYNLEVFDSETWRWRTAMASWNPAPVEMGRRQYYEYEYEYKRVEGIEFKGNLHWPIRAGGGVILAYDPQWGDDHIDEYRLIKMPREHIPDGHFSFWYQRQFNDYHKICIGAGEGHLRYVEFVQPGCCRRECRPPTWTIWRLENYNSDGEGWILENKIDVKVEVPTFGYGPCCPLAIDPCDPKIVYFVEYDRLFYCDMQTAHTGVLETLVKDDFLETWRAVMYVLPVWPTLVPKRVT
ncbi:hypothetical protein Tsubulata_044624 [Turnera subulata]|uniref:F-box domain-containing protein n=1 Tax=Turnera subulata TaxID=218843 RepID=A0A9Q0J919_9ROSI|nr:hypothetical protein Tsubulata_044624 [Turnera subulata]